jgi:hypothetical protein
LAIADPDNALNYFIRTHAMLTSPFAGQFYGIRQQPVMEFRSAATLSNVAIGAMAPADSDILGSPSNVEGVFRINTNKLIRIKGLRLVGNVKVSSEVNTGDFAAVRLRTGGQATGSYSLSSYFVNGHSTRLFVPTTSATAISVVFDGMTSTEGDAGTYSINYNAPFNNVSLLNSQNPPAIASATDSPNTGNWKNQGPAFESIYDRFGTFISPGTVRNWSQFWVKTSDNSAPVYGTNVVGSPGFSGVFGNYQTAANSSANSRTTGMSPFTPSLSTSTITDFGLDAGTTIFRVAGSGVTPANVTSGLGDGEVGAYTNFNALNIRVRTVNRGVDTSNGMTAITAVTL